MSDISDRLAKAATKGQLDIVKSLVKEGANVNKGEYWYYRSPFIAAIVEGHLDVVAFLIENGAKMNPYPLTHAVKTGRLDIVRLLVENGANTNPEETEMAEAFSSQKTSKENIPIVAAAQKGYDDIVQFLIENGANEYDIEGFEKTAYIEGKCIHCHQQTRIPANFLKDGVFVGYTINSKEDKGTYVEYTERTASDTYFIKSESCRICKPCQEKISKEIFHSTQMFRFAKVFIALIFFVILMNASSMVDALGQGVVVLYLGLVVGVFVSLRIILAYVGYRMDGGHEPHWDEYIAMLYKDEAKKAIGDPVGSMATGGLKCGEKGVKGKVPIALFECYRSEHVAIGGPITRFMSLLLL